MLNASSRNTIQIVLTMNLKFIFIPKSVSRIRLFHQYFLRLCLLEVFKIKYAIPITVVIYFFY